MVSLSSQRTLEQQLKGGEWRQVLKGPKKRSLQEKCTVQLENRFEKLKSVYSDSPNSVIEYVTGDIFASGDSIAHSVAKDFNMGRGFALQVRERYGHQAKLRTMSINKGRTANIPVGDHFIFYLCTKWRSKGLPQLADLTGC